jgi:hypothetical protein
MSHVLHDIGAGLKVVWALSPLDNAAGARNSSAIDRAVANGNLYMSCVLSGRVGAASGTPTSFTGIYKLQDSADGSTGWADYGAALATVTTDNGDDQGDINLSSAKRYIRVVETIAFVDGTSPKVEGTAVVVLGASTTNEV